MFNKETEYAIRGLVYIQLQNLCDRKPGVTEISEEIEAPYFYTAKILQRLVKSGFIESLKGKRGGFFFNKDKADLPMKDLILAIEGGERLSSCGFGLKHCDANNPCPVHYQYAPIREAMNKLVTTETIQSLALKYTLKAERNILQ